MTPEEILKRLEKDIRLKPPYGFMSDINARKFYEAELELLWLARRNVKKELNNNKCQACGIKCKATDKFCHECGQRLIDNLNK